MEKSEDCLFKKLISSKDIGLTKAISIFCEGCEKAGDRVYLKMTPDRIGVAPSNWRGLCCKRFEVLMTWVKGVSRFWIESGWTKEKITEAEIAESERDRFLESERDRLLKKGFKGFN